MSEIHEESDDPRGGTRHHAVEITTSRGARLAEWAVALLRVRGLVRAPIWLYRVRLGAVFGSRLLLLEHVGRTTGKTRRVVLEVVSRPAPGRYVVASGFGEAAQWYRNIRADPTVRVQVRSGPPRTATARTLSAAEGAAALAEYSAKHPRSWAALRPVFESMLGARIDLNGTTLPLVALDIAGAAGSARPLTAAVEIAAPPDVVWAVVSDVRRTGEWSPECRRVVPLGHVRRGCWLLGLNRRNGTRWATLSRIVRFEVAREIAWRVVTNGSVWTYRLESSSAGTRLVETRQTPRGVGGVAGWFTRRYLGGQDVHDEELEAGMAAGLVDVKNICEAECGGNHPRARRRHATR